MAKKLIVQKYGGSSVADITRIIDVAKRVVRYKKKGLRIVVVVSAMADTTDRLLGLISEVNPRASEREIDMLLSTGEQVSSSLLAMAINRLGYKAISFTGAQVGIFTDCTHTRARILDIKTQRIEEELRKGKIVVVAGFQGVTDRYDITTLGRGGSDLSAVALSKALAADVCEIYSDVEGVFSADPRIVNNARKLDYLTYDEMLEMASLGAQIMQARSIEVAKKFNVVIHVRSSFTDNKGTIIRREVKKMEEVAVNAVTINKNEAKITVCDVPDKPGLAAKIFEAISREGINVDMIVQNISRNRITDISFTVPRELLKKGKAVTRRISRKIAAGQVLSEVDIARISVVGVGMRSHPGVAAKMFSALANHNINIEMISTSDISISCIIKKRFAKIAVRAIHDEFNLGKR
jgi:aspartate kinase